MSDAQERITHDKIQAHAGPGARIRDDQVCGPFHTTDVLVHRTRPYLCVGRQSVCLASDMEGEGLEFGDVGDCKEASLIIYGGAGCILVG